MNKNLILLTLLFMTGSQAVIPQSRTENLPVIDLLKDYPTKQKNIKDIAELEYIALETTDDVLLSDKAVLSYVSDNYILVHEPQLGDIFVFNRAGKTVSHFNHKGPAPWEYPAIRQVSGSNGTILDEKNGEIFVCSQSIQVYSLSGEHKRTLPVNSYRNNLSVFNFDDESLLVYEDYIRDLDKRNNPNTNPYSLISKKDGSPISVLDIHLPERVTNKITQRTGPGQSRTTQIHALFNLCYGQDFMIADMSSDTLYLLTQDRKITPLLTRTPSAHASDPKFGWTTHLITDKFIEIIRFPIEEGSGAPIFTYEIETSDIYRVSFFDPDADIGRRGRLYWGMSAYYPATNKNMFAELVWPSVIINANKAKQLKGDIVKFAQTLDEDDNPVVRIIKFK